jgi:hypothetical protein
MVPSKSEESGLLRESVIEIMNLFLCTIHGECPAFNRLKKRIEDLVPIGDFRISHSIRDLAEELKHALGLHKIAVLFANNTQGLEAYLDLQESLRDVSIILILPDWEEHTLQKGYRLYPPFTSHVESNLKTSPLF